jgi:hypothetical protein
VTSAKNPANVKPILELSTKGPTKSRGLTLSQVEEAERMVASGEATVDEVEAKYPGYQEASRVLKATMPDLAESMRGLSSMGITESLGSIFKQLDTSRLGINEALRRASESLFSDIDIAALRPEIPAFEWRDPDEATRTVAAEVRELSGIASSMDKNTAALVAVVTELNQKTEAGARREKTMVGLACAAVSLAVVTAIPDALAIWDRTTPIRDSWPLVRWFLRQVGLPV